MADQDLLSIFGVSYYPSGTKTKITSAPTDPYFYETYIGNQAVNISQGDCAYWISENKTTAHLTRGPEKITSPHFATVVRGYAPENRSSTITNKTVLPYVNGCSTKQIFPPDRPGDPTFQMLDIPPESSEQAHHIHSTVRCVYVLSGEGRSIVGMNKKTVSTTLSPGMVCILEKMCPHHFETDGSRLVVLPVHIWSTVPAVETVHPMFSGTFKM